MGAETRTTHAIERERQTPSWPMATRVAFRFTFAYLTLWSLVTQVSGGVFLLPGVSFPGLGPLWPLRNLTIWIARRVLGITAPLVYTGNSGDTVFFWVQTGWILSVAIVATLVWSDFDRRREQYVTLHKWFYLFLRFALAAQMFDYGMAKVIPTQFPPPSLITLVEPVGNLTLKGLLWTSIGASPGYQMFTGWAEIAGGVLLVLPKTTMLGALICLADMIQVWVLNMTYDIPLKQISFHLVIVSLVLLAPQFDRLRTFFFSDTAVPPVDDAPLFRSARANRRALVAQVVFGVYLLGMYTSIGRNYWYGEGGSGSPRSPLYGIWNVDQLAVDGAERLPLFNDYDRRWRRVIFDTADKMAFQRTDDSIAHYGVSVDPARKTIALTKGTSRTWKAGFTFERPSPDRLVIDGTMDDHRIHAQLRLVDPDTFRLTNSPFRWTSPPDQ